MTRSSSRFFLADGLAALGVCFGVWLLHYAFQPASDTPQAVLLLLGGLDILIFCGILGYLLRVRLQDGERLPRNWIIVGTILIAGFLGWISALLLDADRLRAEVGFRQAAEQHLIQIEDAIRQFQQVLPAAGVAVDRKRWDLVHDRYAREYDQLHTFLRDRPEWEKPLTEIDAQVEHLHQFAAAATPNPRNDAPATRERAQTDVEKLRQEIARGEPELIALHRARWHGIGSTALSGVFLLLGCLLVWFVFDRELRRRGKSQGRLSAAAARFRSLVEHQPDPIAVLDATGNIDYVNPAWQGAFHYVPEDLQGRNLFELIHPADRPQAQLAFEKQDFENSVACRLSADYGIWHDVEMRCQEHDDENETAVRFRNLRETVETREKADQPEGASLETNTDALLAHDVPALVYLYDPAARRFASVSNLPTQALGYGETPTAAAGDFLASILHPDDEARVFRGLLAPRENRDESALEDEIRLRDADGQYQWFGVRHRFLPAGKDKLRKVAGLAIPIARQKRAEELRANAERQAQTLAESERQARAEARQHQWLAGTHRDANADGVLILSAQAEVLSWNPALLRLWNLPTETATARSWPTIATHLATQVETGWEEFRRAVADRKTFAQESVWELTLKDGRTLEASTQTAPELPQNAQATVFLFRDVTERTNLKATHRQHLDRHGHLQKSLREHEEQKKGYESSLREHEHHRKHLEKSLREREELGKKLEAALREREGDCRKLEANLREREERCRKMEEQVQGHARDRDEMQAALRDHQERLHSLHRSHERHASSLKTSREAARRLASGIANDFNKILSVVLGYTDVLRESFPKDHMAQNYVDEMRQSATHGMELTQKLLAFSRNHLLQLVPVELNRQLDALDAQIRQTLGREVNLEWDRSREELWIKTDPHPLGQALLHLLDHARQRLPRGGDLAIRTGRVTLTQKDLSHADMNPGSYVQLRLRNRGSDMDEETRNHLFEPYYAGKDGQKSDLSLATANGIIRQSGGCIDVESAPGQGSEIVILLPWTDERPVVAAAVA